MSESQLSEAVTPFSDLGFNDPIKAVQVFDMLNLKPTDLNNNMVRSKLTRVAEFIKSAPDAVILAKRVLYNHMNPHISPLDRLVDYASLQKELMTTKGSLKDLQSRIASYE